MDLIDGSDMSAVLGGESISVRETVTWMIQACEAIGHAHQRGIMHCDLKPGNLLLDGNRSVRVTDFGLARSLCEEARPNDRIEGTASFMAPEQVSGWWGPMTVRTDIYGIGAVFYALLTGVPPYQGATMADVLARVVSGINVIPPIEIRPNVTTSINDVCLRCLAKSSDDRYESMDQLLAALQELQTQI